MYERHYYKNAWEELDKLIEAAEKLKKGGKNKNQHGLNSCSKNSN